MVEVNTNKDRWDNLDPKQDMPEILKEYLADLETAEDNIEQAKAAAKKARDMKKNLRKIAAGKLGFELAQIDRFVEMAQMDMDELESVYRSDQDMLALACKVMGRDMPTVQLSMDDLLGELMNHDPVADNAAALQ